MQGMLTAQSALGVGAEWDDSPERLKEENG